MGLWVWVMGPGCGVSLWLWGRVMGQGCGYGAGLWLWGRVVVMGPGCGYGSGPWVGVAFRPLASCSLSMVLRIQCR